MLVEGSPAPDFELPTDDGGTIALATLRGRPVVAYFYPKDDTSGCTAEAKDFSSLIGAFEEAGAVVVGISPDPATSKAKFRKKHDLAVRLAADTTKATCEAYGVWVEKSMYGRKYMGVERSTFLIDAKGNIARAWRKVKVPGHAQEVLAGGASLDSTRRFAVIALGSQHALEDAVVVAASRAA